MRFLFRGVMGFVGEHLRFGAAGTFAFLSASRGCGIGAVALGIRRYRGDNVDVLFEPAPESARELSVWLPWCYANGRLRRVKGVSSQKLTSDSGE